MGITTISIKEETLAEMIKAKAKEEMDWGKTITWDEFLLNLIIRLKRIKYYTDKETNIVK